MMKSASSSRSTVFVCVPCKRPDTEAPKKVACAAGEPASSHELKTAEAGRDSDVVESENVPVKFARPGNQVGRALVAVVAGGTDQDRGGLTGVDHADLRQGIAGHVAGVGPGELDRGDSSRECCSG